MQLDLSGTKLAVTKHMLSEPRRIGKIEVILDIPAPANADEKDRLILQRVGDHCPVAKSLHPDLEVHIEYHWA